MVDTGPSTDRRRFLGALGAGSLAAGAGCIDGRGDGVERGAGPLSTADVEPVDVIVRFDGDGSVGSQERSVSDPAGKRHTDVERRKRRADATYAPFRRFAATTSGVEVCREFWLADALLATVDPTTVSRSELEAIEGVAGIHANVVRKPTGTESPAVGAESGASTDVSRAQSTSDSPVAGNAAIAQQNEQALTYGVEQIHARPVWEFFGARGEGVDVAVLDTGVDPSGHEGIAESLERGGWAEFDAAGEPVDSEPTDPNGHGTGMSGLLVGETTEDGRRYGVAPGAALYHAKVVDEEGLSFAATVAGLEWAVEQGVDLMSASLGPLSFPAPFVEPFENARGSGLLVFGAVGNAGQFTSASPGNFPTAIGVGAADRDGNVADFSGGERVRTDRYWGPEAPDAWPDEYTVPNVVAAGVEVTTAHPGGSYGTRNGASSATPQVAGAAALALSAARAEGVGEIGVQGLQDAIVDTAVHPDRDDPFAVDPGQDDRYGAGVASALFATASLLASETVTGRVLQPNGSPLPGASVITETGPRTTADGEGRFELELPPGEQPIGAIAPGYEPDVVTVDPASTAEIELAPAATDAPAASLRSAMPERIEAGGTAIAEFEAANVEAVSVELSGAGLIQPNQLALRVNGQSGSFGERIQVDAVDRTPSLTVTLEAGQDASVGTVTPTVSFHGNGDTEQGTTRLLYVHPDPLPLDSTVPSLQAPIGLVAPGTTLELADDTFQESPSEDRSPVVLDRPISLVAAPDASPRIAVEEPDPELPAIEITANDVTIDGVAVAASDASAAIQIGSQPQGRETAVPAGATVRNAAVEGAGTGIDVRVAPAAVVEGCDATASDVGIAAGIGQTTELRGNRIHDVETGIAVEGLVRTVTENRLEAIGGTAIRVTAQESMLDRVGIEQGPIRNNRIEGAQIGIEVTEGAAVGEVEGNQFSDVETTIVGIDGGSSVDADSVLGLVLYGLTGASIAVLFVPYARRRLGR